MIEGIFGSYIFKSRIILDNIKNVILVLYEFTNRYLNLVFYCVIKKKKSNVLHIFKIYNPRGSKALVGNYF